MTTGPNVTELSRFPGPARFVLDVVADIEMGKSVVVVFPDALVDVGVADAVLAEIALESSRSEYCESSGDPFPSRVLSTFGAEPGAFRIFGEWETVVGWEAWHQSWLIVTGWGHPDLCEILDRWPSQMMACGLSEHDRPKLVIGLRLADVSRATLLHLDQLTIAVHWWWGVLDRLDTETRLASVAPRGGLGFVDAAVITEIAGWDLRCIDFLVENWDRTTTGIGSAVARYQQEVGDGPERDNGAINRAVRQSRHSIGPPVDLEQHWRHARVERWGYSIRHSPMTMEGSEIKRRVWLAHNRTLMPHVDDERGRYEAIIRGKVRPEVIEDVVRDDDIIEIGALKKLVNTRVVDIGKTERLRLQFFGHLRNKLAHREPIDDATLRQTVQYLGF